MQPRLLAAMGLWVGLTAGLFSCANIVRPNGGPRDTEGPRLLGAVPAPGARNFYGKEVTFYFDEFLKPGNYSKEVFVSPIPEEAPEVTVFNNRLTVRFREPLRENTTYVITLGKEIKDFNEGNKLKESFTYAFSTGDELDTLSFGGKVTNAWTGKGEAEMTIVLFPADEIGGDSIYGELPVYVVESNDDGTYKFKYLKEGRYKVYGIKDTDNDFTYSLLSERIALAESPIVDFADSTAAATPVELLSFLPDSRPATVKSVRWANDYTLHAEFGESIRDTVLGTFLGIQVIDSVRNDSMGIQRFRFVGEEKRHLYFASPFPRDRTLLVSFQNILDSLGYQSDSVLRVPKELAYREDRGKWFDAPYFMPEHSRLVIPANFALPENLDTTHVTITDSTGKPLQCAIVTQGMNLNLVLQELPSHAIPYTVKLLPTIPLPDGKPLDTTVTFKVNFPDPANFGSVTGEIIGDSSKPGMQYVAEIVGAAGMAAKGEKAKVWIRRIKGPGPFRLDYVPAGNYTIRLLEDADGNGYLTPGSLIPYALPERMITGIPPLTIKGNWETQGFKIHAVQPKSAGKGMTGEDTEEGTEEEEEDPDGKK